MNVVLRRFATVLLLLAVPLRVYAAAAMVFCGQPGAVPHEGSVASAREPVASSVALHASMHDHGDAVAETDQAAHPDGHDAGGHAQDHGSCAACCCTGMIATARYDWKPQLFPTPGTPTFVAIAVPPPVPQRFERPPRISFA